MLQEESASVTEVESPVDESDGAASAVAAEQSAPELVIQPRKGRVPVDWSELVHFRELLYFLVWRDIKVRYKQTVLGAAWAVLQPLFGMLVFTMVFGKFAKVPSDGVPYAVFVLAGLLPWTCFANGVTQSGQSLVNQQQLLTKVYFPRVMVPTASFGAPLLDMCISFGLLAVIMLWYGVAPHWTTVMLPLLSVATVVAGLGVGLTLAALTVSYRDFRFVIPFMIQAWMYVSPVVYPLTLVPAKYRLALALNPMAGILDAHRAAILGTPWNPGCLAISLCSATVFCVTGLYYFRRVERRFADVV